MQIREDRFDSDTRLQFDLDSNMADVTDLLRRGPFDLSKAAIDWVRATNAALTLAQKVWQVIVFQARRCA